MQKSWAESIAWCEIAAEKGDGYEFEYKHQLICNCVKQGFAAKTTITTSAHLLTFFLESMFLSSHGLSLTRSLAILCSVCDSYIALSSFNLHSSTSCPFMSFVFCFLIVVQVCPVCDGYMLMILIRVPMNSDGNKTLALFPQLDAGVPLEPIKAHDFYHSTPIGLDCLGRRRQISYFCKYRFWFCWV